MPGETYAGVYEKILRSPRLPQNDSGGGWIRIFPTRRVVAPYRGEESRQWKENPSTVCGGPFLGAAVSATGSAAPRHFDKGGFFGKPIKS